MSTTTLPTSPRHSDWTCPASLGPALARRLGEARYQVWFGQTRFEWEGEQLTVFVPAQFHKDRINKCYMDSLREATAEVMGKTPSIRVVIDPDKLAAKPAVKELPAARLDPPAPATAGDSAPRPLRAARRWNVLADFVVGPCNRLAYQGIVDLLQDVEEAPRPITLFGPPGVGKTHLLEGLYMALQGASKHHPEAAPPLFLTGEEFTNRFLAALSANQMGAFRKQFRDASALLLDNVGFLAGKKSSQEEFLHTLDNLARHGRPVVVTSEKHPKALLDAMPLLADRLIGGGCWPLELPEKVTRLNMIQAKSEKLRLSIPKDAVEFLADRMRGNVRELEGVLHTVRHYSQVNQTPVTLSTVRQAIAGHFPEQSKVATIPLIEQLVCRYLGMEASRLHEVSRARAVSYPRMLVMFLARRLAGASYGEIGRFYGARSHTTAIAAERRVAKMLADDAPLFASVDRCPVREIIETVEREIYKGA
jgi:chromosomal replication initiator protein